jgi:uncharacterized protein (TIGR02147 family)
MKSLCNEPNPDLEGPRTVAVTSNPSPDADFPERPEAPGIFRYEEYRGFLRDRFAELQARNPSFSQRGLARKAGIANPGFFNEVIKGRRRLSPAAALKMAAGLDLSPEETDYFSALVEYAETRETLAKLAAGKRMLDLRNRHLNPAQRLPDFP